MHGLTQLEGSDFERRNSLARVQIGIVCASVKVVAVFGGSQYQPGDEEYEVAHSMGIALAQAGFSVLTGGYSGLMEAIISGAAIVGGKVLAVTLSEWGRPNPFVTDYMCVDNLHDRQQQLIEKADAFVALRGGPGTLAEVALVWALMQSGLMRPRPLILVGVEWASIVSVWSENLRVSAEDLRFFTKVSSCDEAVRVLRAWAHSSVI